MSKKDRGRRSYAPPDVVPSLAWCVHCGKKAFTKNNAKDLIRILPNRKGMREFPCPVNNETLGWWHAGHLPRQVRQGYMTVDEVYPRKENYDDEPDQAA